MIDSEQETSEARNHNDVSKISQGFELAAGMLISDYKIAALLLVLFGFPQIIFETMGGAATFANLTILWSLNILISAAVLYFVAIRWLKRLSFNQVRPTLASFILLLVLEVVQVSLYGIPTLILGSPAPEVVKFFFSLFLVPGIVLVFRYFFYFIPVTLGVTSIPEIMSMARSIALKEPWIVIKIILGPFAIMTLLSSLSLALSPDGRLLSVSLLSIVLSQTYSILSTYCALAFGLLLMEDQVWRRFELDPYRKARFTTIALSGHRYLSSALLPKNATKILVVGFLVFMGNQFKAPTLKPGPEISIVASKVQDKNLVVTLRIKDQKYNFRGFNPLLFGLAGNKRQSYPDNSLSSRPSKIWLNDNEITSSANSITGPGPFKLELEFETTRPEVELKSLQDLHLWYLLYKVEQILPNSQSSSDSSGGLPS